MALRCEECRTEIEFGKATYHLCPSCHVVLVGREEIELVRDAVSAFVRAHAADISSDVVRRLMPKLAQREDVS